MTVEVALVAEVTLRVQVPTVSVEQARVVAQDAAQAAIRAALGSDLVALSRVLRDDLEPSAHALRVYSWVGGSDPELMAEIVPPPEGDADARP